MKNKQVDSCKHPDESGGVKWISRMFLLFSAGMLLYVSFLCYPSWPQMLRQAIENPKNTTAYQVYVDFTNRLKEGDGVLSAFSESYKLIYEKMPTD